LQRHSFGIKVTSVKTWLEQAESKFRKPSNARSKSFRESRPV
jgi:hypothetical protein